MFVWSSPENLLQQLQEAGQLSLGDFMEFQVAPDGAHPTIQNDGTQYDGLRFRAEGKLAAKVYGQPFGVDVADGDPMFGEPEVVLADTVLSFAGIAPPAKSRGLALCVSNPWVARESRRYRSTNADKFSNSRSCSDCG